MCYAVYMSTTVTVRIDDDLRRALEARARAQGKTLSAIVRETLEGRSPPGPSAAASATCEGG